MCRCVRHIIRLCLRYQLIILISYYYYCDGLQASEGEGGGEDSCPRVKKVMIWTELQASARQVTQIATSACGATAIINVLVSPSSSVGLARWGGSSISFLVSLLDLLLFLPKIMFPVLSSLSSAYVLPFLSLSSCFPPLPNALPLSSF